MSQTSEPVTRADVTVTFLRLDGRLASPPRALPAGAFVDRLNPCSVADYRRLYNGVGGPHLWWLRRLMPDNELQALLDRPDVSIHVLSYDQAEAGFYELDAATWPIVNLSYFGLLPSAVGHGLGSAFLRHAIDEAFALGARSITVNTCTADHPRALPTYRRAGFRVTRQVKERWDVPDRLGLQIPNHLRG